ncbi:MAG: SCO family protein, partial [Acidobacteriota bacterium]|nr:SCO family protein [Acidobacteriota bacterium]
AIPHYMEGMVMPFTVGDPRELADLTPGARITFRIDGTRISRIRRESTGIDDVPAPPPDNRLVVGDPVPAFALTDQNNQLVHLSDFAGRPIVLDFIYTRCPLPDVCPRLSANMARLQKRFGARLTLLSITLDPQFDTPEVLADYARRWRADARSWHFLTGPGDQIRDVAAKFGLVYWAEEGLITHTAVTAIIDSNGKLAALLEGSRFTSQQLLDLTSTTLGLPAQPQAPGRPNPPAP